MRKLLEKYPGLKRRLRHMYLESRRDRVPKPCGHPKGKQRRGQKPGQRDEPWGDDAVLDWLKQARRGDMADKVKKTRNKKERQALQTIARNNELDCAEGVSEFVELVVLRCGS